MNTLRSKNPVKYSSKDDIVFQCFEWIGTNELKTSIDKLNGMEGTLPRLLNDDKVYNNVDSLIFDIRYIVDDFKENPGRYLKAYMKAKKTDDD